MNDSQMQKVADFFASRDMFARHCGIEILEVASGKAKTRLVVQPHHLNGVGIVQGGAIFTLADFAFAGASNSHGTVAVALNVSITFIKATRSGTLTAEAEEVSRGSRVGTYIIRVIDELGEVVALFQGLAYRKQEQLEEL